ncbi:MAG: hypothetical protein WCP34_14910 [Pseudomonadota bacterium]
MKSAILIPLLAGLLSLTSLPVVSAGATSYEFQSSDGLHEMLARLKGQSVKLRLAGGEEIGGKISGVGLQLVQLTEITGRDFFDALVPISSIQAILIKAR